MTEALNSSRRISFKEGLTLDDHALYTKNSNNPIPADAIYHYLDESELGTTTSMPGIKDLDRAYEKQNIKRARHILNHLTRYEPLTYSSGQNRIALNSLAHPMHRYLVTADYQEAPSGGRLAKDIEAIYGHGGAQLAFLLEQFNEHTNPGLRAEIEGSLSELTIFLLATRSLTDEMPNPYLVLPSTEAQDRARITADGIHHGFDLSVIRQHDNTHIPVQVKTSTTYAAEYPDHILVVSVADLVRDNNATPRMLAEAMYFEISGATTNDTQLIEAASKRLFKAFDNY
jgi:hypothetical protein